MTHPDETPDPSRAIRWSERARNDVTAIGDYIALDNPRAAVRWIECLVTDVERAAEMPLAGRVVPELTGRPDIREFLRRTYRIVYRIQDDAIDVLTIFEGHRLFPAGALPDNDQR